MATIREIAERAQVSPAAVSRILNNDTTLNVTVSTKQRVFAAAAELGYTKKERNRKFSTSFTYGILQWYSPQQELDDPYYLSIRLGVENYCSENHINVVRAFRSDSDHMSSLSDVDGLICIGKFDSQEIESFRKITSRFILVDMHTNRVEYNSISLDFETAVTDVMNYFYSLGHRSIGYLGGKEYLNEGQIYPDTRRITFQSFCNLHHITYEPYMLEDAYTSDAGYRMMNQLIQTNQVPSAIFAASDNIAIGAMHALLEHGFQIPTDVSIIGFDDISSSAYTTPPLSTVHAPAYEMGAYAAAFLKTQYSVFEQYKTPLHMALPCQLIKRGSCTTV